MSIVLQEAIIHSKLSFRERQAVFWGFVFPLLLLVLFCSTFGGSPERATTLLAGVICINAMSGSLFGMAVVSVAAREQGILRRYKVAPVALWKIVTGLCASRVFVIGLTSILLVILARVAYKASIPQNLAPFLVVFLIGTLMFCALSFAVAAISRSVAQANGLAQVLFTPMMFLSGATLPYELMPAWMQKIAWVLPATYYIKSLKSTLAGGGLNDNFASLAVMVIFSLFALALSIKFFRWE